MPIRKLSAGEAFWVLGRFILENWGLASSLWCAAALTLWLGWKYVEQMALNVGAWFYPFIILTFLLAASCIFFLYFLARGDIGFRLRAARADEDGEQARFREGKREVHQTTLRHGDVQR